MNGTVNPYADEHQTSELHISKQTLNNQHARKLLKDTVTQLLTEKSLENISITELVRKSGVSRQSFYNNFQDKYDLVNQIFIEDANRNLLLFEKKGTVTWRDVIHASLDTMKQKRKIYTNILKYEGQNSLKNYFSDYIVDVHSRNILGRMDTLRSLSADPGDIIRFHAHGTAWTTADWVLSGMKKDPREMADLIYTCMPEIMKKAYTSAEQTQDQSQRNSDSCSLKN